MKKTFQHIPMSILELAQINEGSTVSDTFRHCVDVAQHAESWGYHRFWLAEHHNMPSIASSATTLLMGHVAEKTNSIRIGSGGVMLPNHAPLIIAEQFGTLETLYPGRIDLGIGRAPGTDQATAYAIRRTLHSDTESFPQLLEELCLYFSKNETALVCAIPGEGLQIPVWLLGSSDYSARLAARLGLPFSFASHFAPQYLHTALLLYREQFEPSETLAEPYAMVAVNVIAADTDVEAEFLATSLKRKFLHLARSEEHTSELQSRGHLVCRLLL